MIQKKRQIIVNKADSDNVIINEVLNGNTAAYNQLILKYQSFVYTMVFNILKNREESEELVHDIFIKAFKNLNSFKQESKFSTWLYRITFNTTISATRKRKYHFQSIEDNLTLNYSTNPLEQNDKKQFIQMALTQLNKVDQMLLTLFYLKECTIYEIVAITSMNINTVKVRLHRARKKLADKLKEMLNEEALTL